ncbi:MAG: nicotinate-nucleotide--dimethylbenzimidazole phosphoribosyltransferase [Ignavibacteriales bacterium]
MELLEKTLRCIGSLDAGAMEACRRRLDSLTKPPGSLGMLEEIAVKLAGITGKMPPEVREKVVLVMAGDHGVASEGVSAYPPEVTGQMVLNFLREGAAINVLARHAGAKVVVTDVGVAGDLVHPGLRMAKIRKGTANMAVGPAMSREEAVACIEAGIRAVSDEIDRGAQIVGTGDMGIGNTTASTAILAAAGGMPVSQVTGRGTGVDEAKLLRKVDIIERALAVNRPDPSDPIDILAKVGGLEIGAIAGTILGAGARRVPAVVDGFISTAGALIAARLCARVTDFMMASHLSEEPGHRIALDLIGLEPVLRMKMRLGEGTGAALSFHLIDASVRILMEMATFDDAGVSGRSS